MTSTPVCSQKSKEPVVENWPFVVHVDDGRALRKMTVQPLDTMYDVRRGVAEILQRHYAAVALGYTTPWFKKNGTKLPRKYIETTDDLRELRADIQDYIQQQKKKQKKENIACEIVFEDMNEGKVRLLAIYAVLLSYYPSCS